MWRCNRLSKERRKEKSKGSSLSQPWKWVHACAFNCKNCDLWFAKELKERKIQRRREREVDWIKETLIFLYCNRERERERERETSIAVKWFTLLTWWQDKDLLKVTKVVFQVVNCPMSHNRVIQSELSHSNFSYSGMFSSLSFSSILPWLLYVGLNDATQLTSG